MARESGSWKLLFLLDSGEKQEITQLDKPELRLRVSVDSNATCRFSYVIASDPISVEPAFVAGEGGWIGAKVGLVAAGDSGSASFDYFRFA